MSDRSRGSKVSWVASNALSVTTGFAFVCSRRAWAFCELLSPTLFSFTAANPPVAAMAAIGKAGMDIGGGGGAGIGGAFPETGTTGGGGGAGGPRWRGAGGGGAGGAGVACGAAGSRGGCGGGAGVGTCAVLSEGLTTLFGSWAVICTSALAKG
eukprot:scaffold884_cov398-Prasinococcus_capsulatus_cf.AAC.17